MSWKNLLPLFAFFAIFAAGLVIGVVMSKLPMGEHFVNITESACSVCGKPKPACNCPHARAAGACNSCKKPNAACNCPCNACGNPKSACKCPHIDWSKYRLKASIPPCPPQPDMSRYMLKTECPAPPDMSRYILKSAVPPCPPCISTCNKPCKIGECPPCPRPRCPVVQCPEPKACPPCAAVEPPRCPDPTVNCKASYEPAQPWAVRPMLASVSGF